MSTRNIPDLKLTEEMRQIFSKNMQDKAEELFKLVSHRKEMTSWVASTVGTWIEWSLWSTSNLTRLFQYDMDYLVPRDTLDYDIFQRRYVPVVVQDPKTVTYGGSVSLARIAVKDIDVRIESDNFVISATWQVDIQLFLNQGKASYDSSFTETLDVASIPFKILSCWMQNSLFNNRMGVSRPDLPDKLHIHYAGGYDLPLWLCSLIRKDGNSAMVNFLNAGFMDLEVFELAESRVAEIQNAAIDLENQEYCSSQMADEAQDDSNPDSSASVSKDMVEAVQYPDNYPELLGKIDAVEEPLTYSEWAKILGYKSRSGPHDLIKKLVKEGLVTCMALGEIGNRVELTQKGQRILGAFG
jgi:hypothetical protein